MTAEECAFFEEGLCAPPEEYGVCEWAKPKSGLVCCDANNSVLFTEKYWNAEHSKMVFTRTVERASEYQRALDALNESVEERGYR